MSARTVCDVIPLAFSAGETVEIRRSFSSFPSSDWTYKLHLNGATATLHRNGEAQDDGSFLVKILPADALPAGAYRFVERVTSTTDETEVHNVGDGILEVELDLATAPAGATLTHAERTLQIIVAAIEGRIPLDLQQYTIAGRIVTKIPIEELLRMRGTYAAMVWRQHNPGKLGQVAEVQFSAITELPLANIPPTWEESLR